MTVADGCHFKRNQVSFLTGINKACSGFILNSKNETFIILNCINNIYFHQYMHCTWFCQFLWRNLTVSPVLLAPGEASKLTVKKEASKLDFVIIQKNNYEIIKEKWN